MKLTKELLDKAKSIQKESHIFIESFIAEVLKKKKDSKIKYEDMVNTYLFHKLAEIELKYEKELIELRQELRFIKLSK